NNFFLNAITCVCFAVFLSLVVSGDADVNCENMYKDFSDCVLVLGKSMDNYQENVTSERGVAAVCSHWEAFHTCALTALSDCQEEVSSIWETLRHDATKMHFQGSLFDLCTLGMTREGPWLPLDPFPPVSLSFSQAKLMGYWLKFYILYRYESGIYCHS
uniref:Neuritin 1b n=1 Tax=Cyclopterus lumpus TaxID=8103 RepID=A0A8C2Z537_CYCLU